MRHFVFCHGFGFNSHFWDNLAPYFANEKCSFIDLGYFKNPSSKIEFHGEKIIGIGHSIGFQKLLELNIDFDCLIGLNSFTDFLGTDPSLRTKRQIELKALEQNYIKNPRNSLEAFYKTCKIKFNEYTELDLDLLLSDLKSLNLKINIPDIPILIMATDKDPIVPRQIIEDNFAHRSNVEIDMLNNDSHVLGFIQPTYVYEKIMSFLYNAKT
jgi:pimeloyl-[acyl-carrier protein] methyl ester esterase